ncbi:DNA-binding MarR family transcriptional regulator [Thermocatellispora tengchongensis]|uniref:DNA-binding MarR family transcriptional regulator n=1 Tax=Thermocatellispora tengchongensis TaxID=1073253 RepID=A0A840NX97_9ACTN|nr:MarR family transcriptional regulator [Thermocatellispora tengchongensis]MBB5130323.1 DNA-binding MarR family transcriptional regulator [Thermocatellispora tengchongensis]
MVSKHRRQAAFRRLHESLVDLIALFNLPQRDEALIAEAGIDLDRALFLLLVGIQRFGPIGVVELAERAGRDHTTVSRQVAKLAELGLVERRPSPADRRVKEAVITGEGRRVTDALDAARQRLAAPVFAEWSDRDLYQFERMMRRFVDDLQAQSAIEKEQDG